MSSPNSPLFYDQHLTHQHSELNQTPIYQQISTHSSDLPIVTVTSSNEGVFEGVGYGNYPEKLDFDSNNQMDDQNQMYSYTLPPPQIPNTSISDDDLIQEISSVQSSDLLSGGNNISTTNDRRAYARQQRRMKMSEAARIRYHSLTTEEKKALNERRIMLRKRKKQKDREMEELERILRTTNDITDDLVPIDDPAELAERHNKLHAARIRYQNMPLADRKAFTLKRRLKQLGLPETTDVNSEHVRKRIAEINSRKAAAARARYHRMTAEERRVYNRRRTESFRYNQRRRRVEEDKLLSTPAGNISSKDLERAQNILLRNAKRAEQVKVNDDARNRYQRKQQEKTLLGYSRRTRRSPRMDTGNNNLGDTNLDSILDNIERDVTRRTMEARQALVRKNNPESMIKEDPHRRTTSDIMPSSSQHLQSPIVHKIVQPGTTSSGAPIIQYVQMPSGAMQNGFILADNKLVQIQCDPQSSQQHAYAINQPQPKYEPGYVNPNQQIIIQYDPQQGQVQHHLQRIEIVQPDQQQQVIHYTAQPHHHQQQQQYVIVPQSSMVQQQQQQQRTSGGSSIQHQQRNTFNENIDGEEVDERILLQRARRAERARRRYREMSIEDRHAFNAKRAQSLKMARVRDEDLCRQGDEYEEKRMVCPDPALKQAIDAARLRRAKRAEAARVYP